MCTRPASPTRCAPAWRAQRLSTAARYCTLRGARPWQCQKPRCKCDGRVGAGHMAWLQRCLWHATTGGMKQALAQHAPRAHTFYAAQATFKSEWLQLADAASTAMGELLFTQEALADVSWAQPWGERALHAPQQGACAAHEQPRPPPPTHARDCNAAASRGDVVAGLVTSGPGLSAHLWVATRPGPQRARQLPRRRALRRHTWPRMSPGSARPTQRRSSSVQRSSQRSPPQQPCRGAPDLHRLCARQRAAARIRGAPAALHVWRHCMHANLHPRRAPRSAPSSTAAWPWSSVHTSGPSSSAQTRWSSGVQCLALGACMRATVLHSARNFRLAWHLTPQDVPQRQRPQRSIMRMMC